MQKITSSLDRHLWYAERPLFPVPIERFRIDVSHCASRGALLLAIERHEMPARQQLELYIAGAWDTPTGWRDLELEILDRLGNFRQYRMDIERNPDPF